GEARVDGRSAYWHQVRHRWLNRCLLPAQTGTPAVLPAAVGAAGSPVGAGRRQAVGPAAGVARETEQMSESTAGVTHTLLAEAAKAAEAAGADSIGGGDLKRDLGGHHRTVPPEGRPPARPTRG